jgi:hypothetical protein
VTVSRRASSVYHFFHAKEELRSAKISAFVLVLAFACWTPYFAVLICLALPSTAEQDDLGAAAAIYWLHLVSCFLSLIFAAVSPYVYVFRSQKVKNCLGKIITDVFRFGELDLGGGTQKCFRTTKRRLSNWCKTSNGKRKNMKGTTPETVMAESDEDEGHHLKRQRSLSCPDLENVGDHDDVLSASALRMKFLVSVPTKDSGNQTNLDNASEKMSPVAVEERGGGGGARASFSREANSAPPSIPPRPQLAPRSSTPFPTVGMLGGSIDVACKITHSISSNSSFASSATPSNVNSRINLNGGAGGAGRAIVAQLQGVR